MAPMIIICSTDTSLAYQNCFECPDLRMLLTLMYAV